MGDNLAVLGLVAFVAIFLGSVVFAVVSAQSKKPLRDVKPIGEPSPSTDVVKKENASTSSVDNVKDIRTFRSDKAVVEYHLQPKDKHFPARLYIETVTLIDKDCDFLRDILEHLLLQSGMFIKPIDMSNDKIREVVERNFSKLLVNDAFLKDEHDIQKLTRENEWVIEDGALFRPVCSHYDHPVRFLTHSSALYLLSDKVTPEKMVVVIGVGGLYLINSTTDDVSSYVTIMTKPAKFGDLESFIPSGYLSVGQKTPIGFTTTVKHCLYMPSITKEVIDKMMQKDMTNIPYYGEFYRAAGYAVVEVRMDNEIYVFCSALGYHGDNDYSTVRDGTIVDELVSWRARRDDRLKKTDYGYVMNEDKAPVYWYV